MTLDPSCARTVIPLATFARATLPPPAQLVTPFPLERFQVQPASAWTATTKPQPLCSSALSAHILA
jgi:hypothetical protein